MAQEAEIEHAKWRESAKEPFDVAGAEWLSGISSRVVFPISGLGLAECVKRVSAKALVDEER